MQIRYLNIRLSLPPLLLLLLLVSFPCRSLSDASAPVSDPPAAPPAPTEQEVLTTIHELEHQLRAQRHVLAALQDARARSQLSADAAAAAAADGQGTRGSEQACALEEGNGQQGECASPNEHFKLVGSRMLGYRVNAAAWLPWAVSHASLYLCIAGDDGALHVYSRTGIFKASHPLPPSCQPTSIDVSGFRTDVVAFIAVGCADASLAIVSISGPPYRSQPRFSAGTPAAFVAADVSKLHADTWFPSLSLISLVPFPSISQPPPAPLLIPDEFYPAPAPSPPDSIQHVLAVHRQRIPFFLYITAGGRVIVSSRNGTLVGAGRVTASHLPATAALYLAHSFVFIATQQGAVIFDFRLMTIASSCTETVQEDVPVVNTEKQTDFEHRQETRSVRRPFTRALIAAAQEATSAESRYVHTLDSHASIVTFAVKTDRYRVKCHVLHDVPGALPCPPPPPSFTAMRGGFVAAVSNHVNIFRSSADGTGGSGPVLEIQMPLRSSSSSPAASPPSSGPLAIGDGAYVLATVSVDGMLTMYQARFVFAHRFFRTHSVAEPPPPELDEPPPRKGRRQRCNVFLEFVFFCCASHLLSKCHSQSLAHFQLRSPMVLGGLGVVVYMKFFKKVLLTPFFSFVCLW